MVFDNPLKPTLDNPTICQDAMRIILASARAVQKAQLLDVADGVSNPKPRLVTLSTTGISSTRDLPCLMKPMYHWMLKVPHDDKHVMETLIKGEMAKPLADRGIDNFVIVRPSLLTDGKGDGLHKIKAGTAENPAVGYVICRNDVGAWLFENLVRGFYGETYVGQIVTITA
ncbi:hypothetical protein ASPZODRAFT_132942 [Penicilliopsis zonata CBS 506.65]|uniref:NAD(P)-binding domain-containing protein n=1 Tax=Penicilliopsis zonata CBS 506.65 TaxID=1073090 RepID=A0A1L9SI56_9EURO|nr:hypothetical protein ASPZODRAFT_132942 [Penicilliopsis zonata CBS 506.65]OJJ46786.1 hypothetical protein ASPZODRAFT_132942 [Penicilliopsis zonata CBS 506.65]